MRFIFFIAISLSLLCASGQNAAFYRIDFKNKYNTPYSLSNPSAYLSPKAIERRNVQEIVIDSTDIPVNQNYINSVKATGAVPINKSRWFNSLTVMISDTTIVNTISSLPFVATVVKTKPYLVKKRVPGSGIQSIFTARQEETNLNTNSVPEIRFMYDYGSGLNQASMLGVDYLHSLGFNGMGMTIAVLDAGFYHVDSLDMFDSLRLQGRLLGTRDFVKPGNNVYKESTHGMAVLSTMAGNIPGLLIGTAPGASYWLLRSEDASSEYIIEEDNWIAAAEFADSAGVDIINSSLGYTRFDLSSQSHTYADLDGNTSRVTRGADMAAKKGILVVNSAGNSGNDSWHYIGVPADADSILTVGAVDAMGNIAGFSSFGNTADNRIKPSVCAQGQGTYVVSVSDGIYPGNGTSFSSPVMAGAVACLWQANKNFSNMQVIDAVIRSSSKYNTPDTAYGHGIPNLALAHLILSGSNPFSGGREDLAIFPNPFTNELDCIFPSTDNAKILVEISDLQGKIVFSKDSFKIFKGYNHIFINNLESLSNGNYIIRITMPNKVLTKQIVKTQN